LLVIKFFGVGYGRHIIIGILSNLWMKTRGCIYHVIMDVMWFLRKMFETVKCSQLCLSIIGMLR
jgi:hypothetical protein